jgi:hypothetical protein
VCIFNGSSDLHKAAIENQVIFCAPTGCNHSQEFAEPGLSAQTECLDRTDVSVLPTIRSNP